MKNVDFFEILKYLDTSIKFNNPVHDEDNCFEILLINIILFL